MLCDNEGQNMTIKNIECWSSLQGDLEKIRLEMSTLGLVIIKNKTGELNKNASDQYSQEKELR